MSTSIDGIPTPELIDRDILDIGEPDEEFFVLMRLKRQCFSTLPAVR